MPAATFRRIRSQLGAPLPSGATCGEWLVAPPSFSHPPTPRGSTAGILSTANSDLSWCTAARAAFSDAYRPKTLWPHITNQHSSEPTTSKSNRFIAASMCAVSICNWAVNFSPASGGNATGSNNSGLGAADIHASRQTSGISTLATITTRTDSGRRRWRRWRPLSGAAPASCPASGPGWPRPAT